MMLTNRSSLLIRLRNSDDSQAWHQFVRLYTPLIHYWVSQLALKMMQEWFSETVLDTFFERRFGANM